MFAWRRTLHEKFVYYPFVLSCLHYPLLQTAQAWIWGKILFLSNSRIFWPMKIKNILYMLGKSYKCLFGRNTVPLCRWEGGGTLWGGVWPWGRSSARNTQIVTFLLWPTKANMYRMLQVLTDRNLSKLKPAWTSTLFQKARICFINSA